MAAEKWMISNEWHKYETNCDKESQTREHCGSLIHAKVLGFFVQNWFAVKFQDNFRLLGRHVVLLLAESVQCRWELLYLTLSESMVQSSSSIMSLLSIWNIRCSLIDFTRSIVNRNSCSWSRSDESKMFCWQQWSSGVKSIVILHCVSLHALLPFRMPCTTWYMMS